MLYTVTRIHVIFVPLCWVVYLQNSGWVKLVGLFSGPNTHCVGGWSKRYECVCAYCFLMCGRYVRFVSAATSDGFRLGDCLELPGMLSAATLNECRSVGKAKDNNEPPELY